MSEEKLVKVCPVCGNSELYYEAGGYGGKVYHCKACGYIGAFVVEANEELLENIKRKYEQERQKAGKKAG
ncbi:MAG: hypothetical protein PHD41_04775 [Methanosarcinaceae archaeon]|nr:hypothetical protein [Methanosarcinaceae archaeon]MDD4331598.1 hypothetical protein [Methanosarcinaceae archaeon]MDD4749371.1 hypothetical protein [Methanosarcinaceae archaeon]